MRFVLHRAALDASDAGLRRLDTLIDRCEAGIHRLESPDADLLEDSKWYQGARISLRGFVREISSHIPKKHAPKPGKPHYHTQTIATPQDINLAASLSVTPLTILVENKRSDGAFLRVMIEELGEQALNDLLEINAQPPALQIDSSGGIGEIPALIQGSNTRHFVLFDSDARWPGDNGAQPDQRRSAVNACQRTNTRHHVWRKRCIENYIPDEVIEALIADRSLTNARQRLEAILHLSPAQRDHVPMKDPLTDNEQIAATDHGLYDLARDGASLALFRARAPLPHKLPQLLRERRGYFTSDGLIERDRCGELTVLLNAITEEL